MVSDKTKDRIKKLQALAERGVGGEKDTAKRKLEKLLEDNNIFSLEELDEDKIEYFLFSYKGDHEIQLLRQCVYKVLGASTDRTAYRTRGTRQKLGYYCTKAQKLEIELEFEFYRNAFYEELTVFMSAFIQKQGIFPPDAPKGSIDQLDEKDLKMAMMAQGINKKSRAKMIENKGE
nr:DUF2786 domain-containing protein [uncultured Clostridium sp.]